MNELPARRVRPLRGCHGARYSLTLEGQYKEASLDAIAEPGSSAPTRVPVTTLVEEWALGYFRTKCATLSGGEAQRVKAPSCSGARQDARYVLDEPTTTACTPKDCSSLVLQSLAI